MMEGLLDREFDYIIMGDAQFMNFVYKTRRTDFKINEEIGSILKSDTALGFQKNDEGYELASLVSSAMKLVDLRDLRVKYFENVSIESYYRQEQLYLGIIIVGITLAAIILLLITRRRLRVDFPTGTLNRFAFKSDYKKGIPEDETFIFIDINRLKHLNDVYGHLNVDKMLFEYCKKIAVEKRRIYRVGGDEFIIIDKFKDKKEIQSYAEFLSEQSVVLQDEGIDLNFTASIGVIERVGDVLVGEIKNQRSYLLSLADYTMYRAKKEIGETIRYCDQEDIDSHSLKIEIEHIVGMNIPDVGIYPVFQPLVSHDGKNIIGFESLARWETEDKKYFPDQFIPVFENLNKIHELDLFIFEKAVKFLSDYRNLTPENENTFVSVNFSVRSLGSLDIEDFEEIIEKYKVPRENILIEITESSYFDDNCVKLIKKFKAKGYRVAIDDFTSGHSTINSIVELDVDVVKVDRYVVSNVRKKLLAGNDYSKELLILEAITKLLNSIGTKVVIEGVETDEVFSLISNFEVDYYQGYLFGKPQKKEVFEV
jgi:diguanylate cyclase (GGDEF)-like protein